MVFNNNIKVVSNYHVYTADKNVQRLVEIATSEMSAFYYTDYTISMSEGLYLPNHRQPLQVFDFAFFNKGDIDSQELVNNLKPCKRLVYGFDENCYNDEKMTMHFNRHIIIVELCVAVRANFTAVSDTTSSEAIESICSALNNMVLNNKAYSSFGLLEITDI